MKKRNITKAALAVLSVMTIGAGSAALAACDGCDDVHEHSYGSWTIVNNPTLESGGTAERYCSDNDGGKETYPLPALTDTAVWTESVADYTAPTHTTEGSRTFSSEFGTVTVTVPKTDDHSFGSWTITKQPTMTETGTAERTCSATDAYKETATVPALSDASVWTEKTTETVPPTHTAEGKKVYTSVYGSVTVTLPAEGHDFGAWVITTEPTLTAGGEAVRSCNAEDCAEDATATEKFTLPALSDTSFWTAGDPVEADYNHGGSVTYINEEYGSVTVATAPKLVAPYDNKSYSSINFSINDKGTISVADSWRSAIMQVGSDGVGYCTGYPFRGKLVFEMLDITTGHVKITQYEADGEGGYKDEIYNQYYAYVDVETGILVLQSKGWSEVNVAIPSETAILRNDFKASTCIGDFVISYNLDGEDYAMLVTEDGTYFGVSVSDGFGTQLDAGNCFDLNLNQIGAAFVSVDGKIIKGYAYNGEKWNVSDGMEGVYKLSDGRTVMITGGSIIGVINDDGSMFGIGKYMVVDAEGRVIGATLSDDEGNLKGYYEYTLSGDGMSAQGGTCTEVAPKVTVTINYNGTLPTGATEMVVTAEYSKFTPLQVGIPESEKMMFRGWYLDAACTQEAELTDGVYIPDGDVTLYAKWVNKITIELVGLLAADADKAEFCLGEGDTVGEYLNVYAKHFVDEAGKRYFAGWYADDKFEQAVSEDAEITSADDGMKLYAKWEALHVCYGEYSGRQILSGDTVRGADIKIGVDGTITGSFVRMNTTEEIAGKISAYDAQTQVVTWIPDSDKTKTYIMWFNAEEGIFVIPAQFDGTEMDNYPYVLTRDGNLGANVNFGSNTVKVNMISYGSNKVALLHGEKVYGNVTLTDAFGESLGLDNVLSFKTLVALKDGKVITTIGTTAANFGSSFDEVGAYAEYKQLDSYYGIYNIGGVEYRLDGVGIVSWTDGGEEKKGYYTLTSEPEEEVKTFDVFVRKYYTEDDGSGSGGWDGDYGEYSARATVTKFKNIEYYVLTIGEGASDSSFVKPVATLTYSDGSETTESVNIKVEFTLPVAEDTEDKVFRGWYENADFSGEPITAITFESVSDVKTVYAKWLEKVTLTINYNKDGANVPDVIVYGKGEVAEAIEEPTREEFSFAGWYTTPDCSEGSEWDAKAPLTENTVIYAKWKAAFVLTLHYNDGSTPDKVRKFVDGETFNLDNFAPEIIYIDGKLFTGWYTDEACTASFSGNTISENTDLYAGWEEHAPYDLINENASSAFQYGFTYDEDKGYYASANKGQDNTQAGMIFKSYLAGVLKFEYQVSSESGWDKLIINLNSPTDTNALVVASGTNGTSSGGPLTDGWKSLEVELSVNQLLYIYYKKDNSGFAGADTAWVRNLQFKPFDLTLEGDYTCENAQPIHLDGKSTITQGEKTGNYSHIEDNLFEVYFTENGKNTEHYMLELDRTAKTYSFTAVTTVISYQMNGHGEMADVNAFTEVEFTLPAEVVVENWRFKGWYENAECTGKAVTSLTPKGGVNYVFYAKWVEALNLTFVVGNGFEDIVKTYEESETFNLDSVKPELPYVNGKVFIGWYIDEECTTPAELTTLERNETVYAKWVESEPYLIKESDTSILSSSIKKGFAFDSENGWYASTNKGTDNSASGMSVTAYAPGVVTLQYQVSSENSDKLSISVSGKNPIEASGANGIVTGGTTPLENGWVDYSVELDMGDVLRIIYNKDYNTNVGADTAWIRNIIFVPYDMSVAGDYTCAGEEKINLNGKYTITRGSLTGTYEATDAENTYDVLFMEGGVAVSHYTLVINKDDRTYTLTAVTTNIAYVMNGHGAAPDGAVFTDVPFTLPDSDTVTADGYFFLGWYTDEACTEGNLVTQITPVEGQTYTYYAKWIEAFTLTIVYGNNLDNRIVSIPNGNAVNLNDYKPGYTDGQSFDGWYSDAELTNAVTETEFEINGDATFYVKWKEGELFEVEGKTPTGSGKVFTEQTPGVWVTEKSSSGDSFVAIKINQSGTLTFNWKAIDGDPDNDGVDSQMQYATYGADGNAIKSWDRAHGSMSTNNNIDLDACTENTFTLSVTEGTTVYIKFNRTWAGSNACAKIYNIQIT